MITEKAATDLSSMEPHTRRVALVHGTKWGSGYAVTTGFVLTSRHVVAKVGSPCQVWPERGGAFAGVVIWRSGEVDAALIAVPGEPWRDLDAPLSWAKLEGSGSTLCLTPGYAWVSKVGSEREFKDFEWKVLNSTGQKTGTYHLSFDGNPPRDRWSASGERLSVWSGLSGAAVMTPDGQLLGVVRDDMDKFPNSEIGAVRVSELVADAAFTDLVGTTEQDLVTVRTRPEAASAEPKQARIVPDRLLVNRIPLWWRPDGRPCPVDDGFAADLGAWLCLRRGRSVSVLATPADLDFAEALNRVETGPIRAAGDAVVARVWRRADVRIGLPDWERQLVRLRDLVAPDTGGRGLGLVVEWQPDDGESHVRECLGRIQATAPHTAVALTVGADLPVDAVAAATALARALVVGPHPEAVDVFAWLWPVSAGPVTGPVRRPDGSTAKQLMATVRDAALRRNLPTPRFAAEADPLPPGADPREIAEALVIELNAEQCWGGLATEAEALRLIRDFEPGCFTAIVERHAAAREPGRRWASLQAAMPLDRHVDAWLSAVPAAGEPKEVPPVLRENRLIDVMVLAMLRSGSEQLAPWAAYAADRQTPAGRLARYLAATAEPDLTAFLAGQGALAGCAATRAGLLVTPPGDVGSHAWWAVMGRSPVTSATVAWLSRLGQGTRRAAGFTDAPREPDIDLAELIGQLRTAMRPPLSVREERS